MLKANQELKVFFSNSRRSVDGVAAMYLSIIAVVLVLLSRIISFVGANPIFNLAEWELSLILVPFICLASYVWLNMSAAYGRQGQIVNAVLLSIFPTGIIFKSLQII
ncbi:MAG: hypothetical protein HOP24_11265 [Sideroxydans sp.]|nr:hypothetical protein [Sideroxydans sp.]